MNAEKMPAEEIAIDSDLVGQLLTDQHPDLAALPIDPLANGWDNVMFRLGSQLTIRLPRRAAAAELVRHEQQWLPPTAARLPLPIPAPVRVGTPTEYYPWYWSILPWLPGACAALSPPVDPHETATQLGQFLAAMHQPAPLDAPINPYRGVPLIERDETLRRRVTRLGTDVDAEAILGLWEQCLAAPVFDDQPRWLHGDLHPANILVDGGRISAIIDFGDITSGDPAGDHSVAWMLVPASEHGTFRSSAGGIDEPTWTRARGWALNLGLAYLAESADNPMMQRIGIRTLAAVLAEG